VGDESTTGRAGTPGHLFQELTQRAAQGEAEGARAAAELGHAAEALHLEVVPTGLQGRRALVGHVLGMHLLFSAEGLHGPREAPAFVYLFSDALAVRPTGDAPMSTVPVFGLHMVLPPVAVARWLYKAGRIAHANIDLVKDLDKFEASLADWTVDDFAEADPKLEVYRAAEMDGPLHVYQHLGFARVAVPTPGGRLVRLKSGLPVTGDAVGRLQGLFGAVEWPNGLNTDAPPGGHEPGH
jgi:hypothetical protein